MNDKEWATWQREAEQWIYGDVRVGGPPPELTTRDVLELLVERDSLRTALEASQRDVVERARAKAKEWRSQAERWQNRAAEETDEMFRTQSYADRDCCLSKMSAMITFALELESMKSPKEEIQTETKTEV